MSASPGGWKTDAINAAEQWLSLTPGSSGQHRWKSIGQAKTSAEPGWLMLDRCGDPINPDTLDDLCFAANGGPDVATAYPIETFRQLDDVFLIKEPAALPAGSRTMWVKSTSLRLLVDKLLTGLRESGTTPIADAFAAGRLAVAPTHGQSRSPGLVGAQIEAYRACLNPGVRVVWGPPGAGKTRVLARAIEDLVNEGRRVLLVSTANVAVDNALHAVVKAMRPARGTVVGVGPPHLAEVANNPDVQLQQLAATASSQVDEERLGIEQQLADLDGITAQVNALSERVGGFSSSAYQAASQRIDNGRRLEELTVHVRDAEQVWEAASRDAAAQRATAQYARNEAERVTEARDALSRIDEWSDQLRGLELDIESKQAELTSAELRLRNASGWRATRKTKRARDEAAQDLASFEQLVGQQRPRLAALITAYQAKVGPITRDHIERLDADLCLADQAAGQANQTEASAAAQLRSLRAECQVVRDVGLPTSDDQSFVCKCIADDLPAAFEQLQRVKSQQRQAASCRGILEERHRYLVDKSRELRQDAEKALIDEARMVATTLARSRLNRVLATSSFDVVLVDEAGAATLIEVLLALCRATTTAVLFGDFLQLSPVQNSRLTNSTHEALRRWVLLNPFTHVNIRTPAEAIKHPGCVPLLHQFRFGPRLRELANDVIYDVLCDASELPGVTIRADTDIVFVNTSGLGELAQIHHPGGKRGWWPAGLVLSRALAEHHLPEDGEVGIVTPYGHQRDAIRASLRDRGLVTGIPVGTVHAFQGREFPTVVFDLVEDGHGWIAAARRDRGKYEDDGVRLFGVGITRAQHRLYLIGDRGAVRQAARGPLSVVREAGLRERIQMWSGAALLGMAEPPQFVDSAFIQVSEMLRNLVTVTDISDEKTFYAELKRALNSANRRVWMWSPWISTRAEQVIPLIETAVSRGVDICVFLRPDDDRNMAKNWAQRQLPALYSSGATVIRSDHEHRKIVVIDEQTVLFGSLNVLSNSKGSNTRESMLTLKGSEFVNRLLEELRVRDLGTPHPCAHCSKVCQVKRGGGKRTAWSWYCASCQRSEAVPESTQHK